MRQGAYNVNRQRSRFNNFMLDGMDNNAYDEDNERFDNQIIAVAADSVAQFQVVTNNFNHTNFYLPGAVSVTQGATTQTFSTGATPPLSAITPRHRQPARSTRGLFSLAPGADQQT